MKVYTTEDEVFFKAQALKFFRENQAVAYEIAKLVEDDDLKRNVREQLYNHPDLSYEVEITSEMVEAIKEIAAKEIYNLSTDERYYQCIDNAINMYFNKNIP